METHVESFTESLTHPQFSEQGFLDNVDYDDTALEEMLHNAHRVHVYHSQREGLSIGQSSSSVSEWTERSVGERTGRPVRPSGQELNVGNAQIRTLLDRQKEQILAECQAEIKRHEFQADYDRGSVRKLSETIESQQEELHCAQAEDFSVGRVQRRILIFELIVQSKAWREFLTLYFFVTDTSVDFSEWFWVCSRSPSAVACSSSDCLPILLFIWCQIFASASLSEAPRAFLIVGTVLFSFALVKNEANSAGDANNHMFLRVKALFLLSRKWVLFSFLDGFLFVFLIWTYLM